MSRWKELRDNNAAMHTQEEENPEYPPIEAIEEDLKNTLDDVAKAFRERASRERQRHDETCDSLYYFTVFFSNREQMIEFCERFNLDYSQYYIDGREFAKQLKRTLRKEDTKFAKTQPLNKDYVDRALPIKQKPRRE